LSYQPICNGVNEADALPLSYVPVFKVKLRVKEKVMFCPAKQRPF